MNLICVFQQCVSGDPRQLFHWVHIIINYYCYVLYTYNYIYIDVAQPKDRTSMLFSIVIAS